MNSVHWLQAHLSIPRLHVIKFFFNAIHSKESSATEFPLKSLRWRQSTLEHQGHNVPDCSTICISEVCDKNPRITLWLFVSRNIPFVLITTQMMLLPKMAILQLFFSKSLLWFLKRYISIAAMVCRFKSLTSKKHQNLSSLINIYIYTYTFK